MVYINAFVGQSQIDLDPLMISRETCFLLYMLNESHLCYIRRSPKEVVSHRKQDDLLTFTSLFPPFSNDDDTINHDDASSITSFLLHVIMHRSALSVYKNQLKRMGGGVLKD